MLFVCLLSATNPHQDLLVTVEYIPKQRTEMSNGSLHACIKQVNAFFFAVRVVGFVRTNVKTTYIINLLRPSARIMHDTAAFLFRCMLNPEVVARNV